MYSEKHKLHERQKNHKPGDLRTVALDVTPTCKMKCPHCYAETFAKVKPVDLEILQKTLEELYELGVFHYILQGGEPIDDPDRLNEVIRMIHPSETYITVVTNGWGMTLDRIRWLKSLDVDKVTFSLDSGIEEEHDNGRLPGSYKKVIEGIDNVLEEGLIASVSTVATHKSLYSESFNLVYEFAKKKGIRIDLQIAEPVGNWDGRKDLLLKPEDSDYIKDMQMNCPTLPTGQKMIHRDIYTGEKDHCPAGIEFMAISPNGEVLPCNFLQFSLGNIKDRTFKEMRDDLLTSKWYSGKPNCLCGEDDQFIDSFITPYIDHPKPLDAYEIFNLNGRR